MDFIKTQGEYENGHYKKISKHGLKNRRKAWHMCKVAGSVADKWPKYIIKKYLME
jgi:hypothetical protein